MWEVMRDACIVDGRWAGNAVLGVLDPILLCLYCGFGGIGAST